MKKFIANIITKQKRNNFLEFRDGKSIPDTLKFSSIIKILTLRHLLHSIFTEEKFRAPEIANKFYVVEKINFKELKQPLIYLRNYIAHFNYKEYKADKNLYMHSLLLYEISLGCSLGRYNFIPNKLGYKPNMRTIINTIYDLAPELFKKDVPHSSFPYNKDRMIVDMYEDIAVLNGWEYQELKSQWDVIRAKYEFSRKQMKENSSLNLELECQLSLLDDVYKADSAKSK